MKLEDCRQIFGEYCNTEFDENQLSWIRFLACGRTDRQVEYRPKDRQVEFIQTDRQDEANGHLSKLNNLA